MNIKSETREKFRRIYLFLLSARFVVPLLLLLSLLFLTGIIIPQGLNHSAYTQRYSPLTVKIIEAAGMDHLFTTAYFRFVLFLVALQLAACTVKRMRSLFSGSNSIETGESPGPFFLVPDTPHNTAEKLSLILTQMLFSGIKTAKKKNGRILIKAKRGSISLFGSSFVHIGLLFLLFGGYLMQMSGFDKQIQIVEGDSCVEPLNNYLLRINTINLSYYPPQSLRDKTIYPLKEAKVECTILEDGEPVFTRNLKVGEAISYKGIKWKIDDKGFGWVYRLNLSRENGREWTLSVWPWNQGIPISNIGWIIFVHHLFPDYYEDEDGRGGSFSPFLKNPAVEIWLKDGLNAPSSLGLLKPQTPLFYQDYTFRIYDFRQYATLYMSKKPGIGIVFTGFALIMGGLLLIYSLSYIKTEISLTVLGPSTQVVIRVTCSRNRAKETRLISSLKRRLLQKYPAEQKGGSVL